MYATIKQKKLGGAPRVNDSLYAAGQRSKSALPQLMLRSSDGVKKMKDVFGGKCAILFGGIS